MPVIGVTTSITEDESILQLNRSYISALTRAGTLPVLLPATTEASAISRYVSMCDGLLLSGGGDVDPALYGASTRWECGAISPLRDAFELAICREMLQLRKPILAICRGIQVLNVALGGTLYQDLQSQYPGCQAHRQKQPSCYAAHAVSITPGSQLADILGTITLQVNSLHHQAVKSIGEGVAVCATSPDGVIEAIEVPELPFCIGVQWHPERLWNQAATAIHSRLFRTFAEVCGR